MMGERLLAVSTAGVYRNSDVQKLCKTQAIHVLRIQLEPELLERCVRASRCDVALAAIEAASSQCLRAVRLLLMGWTRY